MPGRGALGRNKGPLGQGLGEERLWGQGLHAPTAQHGRNCNGFSCPSYFEVQLRTSHEPSRKRTDLVARSVSGGRFL